MKKCPFCAEDVQDAAVYCKHCHRDIPAPPAPTPKASATVTRAATTQPARAAEQAAIKARPIHFAIASASVVLWIMWMMNDGSFSSPSPTPPPRAAVASTTTARPVGKPPGTLIAEADCGCTVTKDDPRARTAEQVLERLAANWHVSAEELARLTIRAKELLNERGIAESGLAIAQGFDSQRTLPFANYTFEEHGAMYVTLRQMGRTHAAAIAQLPQAMMDMALKDLK
jgi:hypothetical protein